APRDTGAPAALRSLLRARARAPARSHYRGDARPRPELRRIRSRGVPRRPPGRTARPDRGGRRAGPRPLAGAPIRHAPASRGDRAAGGDERLRLALEGLVARQRTHGRRADQADDDRRGGDPELARPGPPVRRAVLRDELPPVAPVAPPRDEARE